MIFWTIVFIILLIIGIVFTRLSILDYYKEHFGYFAVSAASFILCIIVFLANTIAFIEYMGFKKSFETQRYYYETLPKENHHVVDVIAANKELAEWQVDKQIWGFMSIVPDEILDIKPIGAE